MQQSIAAHIETTPGVCGGRPRIAGTRIRVQDIALLIEQGLSPDEIAAGYPHLSLADIYAALAYYHDHRETIDEHIRQSSSLVNSMRRGIDVPNSAGDSNGGDPVSP